MNDDKYPATTIMLRNNAGMLRDAWITDEGYLVIRQTKFDSGDGTGPVTKMIRLSPEECKILQKLLNGTQNGTQSDLTC